MTATKHFVLATKCKVSCDLGDMMRLLLVLAVLGLASAFVPRNMLKARSGLVRDEMSESTTAEGGSPNSRTAMTCMWVICPSIWRRVS